MKSSSCWQERVDGSPVSVFAPGGFSAVVVEVEGVFVDEGVSLARGEGSLAEGEGLAEGEETGAGTLARKVESLAAVGLVTGSVFFEDMARLENGKIGECGEITTVSKRYNLDRSLQL